MTLITAAANFAFVVQVADRLLTGPTGPLGIEQTKAIHFSLPTADFLVGYTGLAMIGPDPMHRRLMEVLSESARLGNYELLPTAEAFTAELTALFRTRALTRYSPQDRRLSVMMTGFHRVDASRHTVVQGLWSNFQDWGVDDAETAWNEFRFTPFSVRSGETWPTLVQRIGAYAALSLAAAESQLRPLLGQGRPPAAVRDKILSLLDGQSAAHPTIGSNANAAVLYPNGAVEWTFRSGTPLWRAHGGNTVIARPQGSFIVADPEIHVSDSAGLPIREGAPLVVPAVARRRPCPCGSGFRYRHCHGRRLN